MKLEVYTDGSADNKNKERGGAWAFYSRTEKGEIYLSGIESGRQTNNTMELMAVIVAIRYFKKYYKDFLIEIKTDSRYVSDGYNSWMHKWQRNGWKKKEDPIKNQNHWIELHSLKTKHPLVSVDWVKGHSGVKGNDMADLLATKTFYEGAKYYRDDALGFNPFKS